MKTINSTTLLILLAVCVIAQVLVVMLLCEITWPPLIHVLGVTFLLNSISGWVLKRRKRERKRIRKTYMVGDQVVIRRLWISRKFPFLLKRPVTYIVMNDYKLCPIKSQL